MKCGRLIEYDSLKSYNEIHAKTNEISRIKYDKLYYEQITIFCFEFVLNRL